MKRALLSVLAVLLLAGWSPSEPAGKCATGMVRLQATNIGIRAALRAVARQTELNIAVDPRLRGSMALSLDCVPARDALRAIATRAGAAYCDEGDVVRFFVSGREERCRGIVFTPPPVRRAALPAPSE